jgi:hypothetical protein
MLLVMGLLVPSLWITLGPGEHSCSVSLGGFRGEGADSLCRAGFGIGSALGLLVLALLIRSVFAPKNRR